MIGVVAALGSAAIFGVAAVAQAVAVRRHLDASRSLSGFLGWAWQDPLILLVVLGYLAGFVLHAVAIWLTPLYLAQAAIALSLPVTAWSARRVHEGLTMRTTMWVGVAVVGLVLVASGAGEPGELQPSWVLALCCIVGVFAVFAGAQLAATWGGAALGTVAGLGYAGSALAVRGLDTPVSTVVMLTAIAVPALGIVAFWAYSLAMTDAAVTAATAPLIVGQTLVPAVIGVAFMGDGVRDGWWAVVLLGMVLATASAVMLSRSSSATVTASSPRPVR